MDDCRANTDDKVQFRYQCRRLVDVVDRVLPVPDFYAKCGFIIRQFSIAPGVLQTDEIDLLSLPYMGCRDGFVKL